MAKTYTHKRTKWTRESVEGSYGGRDVIRPTDGSGDRIVALMHAGDWQNLDADDKALQDQDRVVVIDGAPLPGWAEGWLLKVIARNRQSSQEAFEAMQIDVDNNELFGRGNW